MKELSVEDKARRYDEAIKKAEEYYKEGKTLEYANDLVSDIFHAIKGSEDERIRKEIIDFLRKGIDGSSFEDVKEKYRTWISWLENQSHDGKKWIYEDVYLKEKEQLIQDGIDEVLENPQKYGLEKQGEHANFLFKIQVGDKVTRNEDGVLVNLSQLNRVAKKDERQGEPIDKIVEKARTEKQRVLLTETDGSANIDWDCRSLDDVKLLLKYGLDYIKKLEKKELKKIEQKSDDWIQELEDKLANATPKQLAEWKEKYFKEEPAWSEEDERKLELLKALVEDVRGDSTSYSTRFREMEELNNWLKTLKDRVQPQPKQGWNEDTQQWIDTIIKDYEELYDADKDHRATTQAKISVLKSLRPHSTWKPSEEQMKALNYVVNLMASSESPEENDYYYYVFKDLREQLKKLKEENYEKRN